MSNIPEQLLDFLEELVTTELKKFQWYLTNSVEDDKRIPKSQLENADRHDTVDKMVQKYGTFGAVNMTEVILKKMGNNQLAEKLRTSTRGSSPATSVKENIGYDTVAAAEKRIQKQSALKEVQRKWQQTIQEKEKKVQELKQAVDTLKRSAQAAVEDSEKIFNELIRSIKKKCCEVKELIRDREKIELSRAKGLLDQLEQEIADLKRRNPELEQLYHTEDHIHFLQKFQSLLVSSGSEDSTSIPVHQHLLFDGVKKSLSDLKERLEEFCMEEFNKIPPHAVAVQMILPSEPKTREDFVKDFCQLTLDPNTAHHRLSLSEQNRVVTRNERVQRYSDHSERFDRCVQVLSKESVCGRGYWEVEWSSRGYVSISVSYKGINRKQEDIYSKFGHNSQSWSLRCASTLTFWHNNIETKIPGKPPSKIGVHVDHSAGTLSFYRVSDTMTVLHTVHATFTQPIYAGFKVGVNSTVRLCDVK